MATHPHQSPESFTGRGRRAWIRGSLACRAASQSFQGRRWPCPSEPPVHRQTPQRTDGPRCWRGTPDWRLLLSYSSMSLQRGRQTHDSTQGSFQFEVRAPCALFIYKTLKCWSYHFLHMSSCCCSLHSSVATLGCCCQPTGRWETRLISEFLQTQEDGMNDVLHFLWIYPDKKKQKRAKNNRCPSWCSRQANKSWIPKLWASLFHFHLKAKVAACTPFPCPALSVANWLYQWKQHQFVQDDTFSE